MKQTITTIVILFACILGYAQDPIFTQYYMVPQTLNPGITGIRETSSAGIIHRSQWPSASLKINTDYAFYNTFVEGMNSGIGISALSQRESFSNYNLLQGNISYSYRVQLSRYWYFHPGIEVGYGTKSYGFQNLVLGDQLNIETGEVAQYSGDPTILNDNVGYFDFSAGAIINNGDFWFGLSVKHLNRPNISFTNTGNIELEMLFNVSGSYTMEFPSGPWFTSYGSQLLISANYMQQGEYNRFDLGFGLKFDPMFVGVIASTNPARNDPNAPIVTSLNPYLGVEYSHFNIGYSYDVVTNGMGHTGGIHEISFKYIFDLYKECDGCPDYYKGPKSKTYLY